MTITQSSNNLLKLITGAEQDNCAAEMIARSSGYHIDKELTVGGTGDMTANVLQVVGTVVVTDQWAIITRVGTLTNLTNMYATLYDGTNTVQLSADGSVLSGMPVGTFFTKDQVYTQPYTVNDASQCRMSEVTDSKKAGRPFIITQKGGTDTFVQLNLTTTDNPIDFDVKIHFEYYPINGSTLTFL